MTTSSKRFTLAPEGLPSIPLLMLATLDALRSLGGSASIQELVDEVIEQEQMSEEEQSYFMPNGRDRRINYYLAWARTYLKRGNALENSARGVWATTVLGESLTSLEQTQAIYEQVGEEERLRAKQKRQAQQATPVDDQSVQEPDAPTNQKDSWKDILLEHLGQMSPAGFERLAQRLLREAGFVKVEVRGKTGDGGIDGVGILRVNLVTFQVYFQCKRWVGSVGSKEIRDFRGALEGRADKGLFITTATFTKSATEEATRDGAKAIDLIDGGRLCDLMKEFELGVNTRLVEQVSIDPTWIKEI